MAPGPAIRGIPIGLIAMSSLSCDSSCSAGVVLERPTLASSILSPFLKKSIPPIIWNASSVIPKKLKIREPRIANNSNVIKAVAEPFFAILTLSSLENLSVITISNGAIPMGLIRVKSVVKQSIKNCVSDWMKSIITSFRVPICLKF